MLRDEIAEQFDRVALADPIKNMITVFHYLDANSKIRRVNRDFIEQFKNISDYKPDSWNTNVRDAMIAIGEGLRAICPNVWIDLALRRDSRSKIITDIRHENEINIIKETSSSIIVRILRRETNVKDGELPETALLKFDKLIPAEYEGPIEMANVPFDYVLRNDEEIDDLRGKIKNDLLPFILSKWKYFT